MTLRTTLFAALLALSGAAIGATPPPSPATGAGPGTGHERPCQRDPAKCQAEAAKFDQWCSANAEKCTDLKAWAVRRAEYCKANAQKCEEHRERMRERREECRDMKNGKPMADEPGGQPSDDQQEPPPPAG